LTPDHSVVVWLALSQAAIALGVSHLVAERAYRVALDQGYLARFVRFGWPIWLSAFPLVAVYQGDRMIVGGLLGIEELASYTVAFMITMVPGLIAARIGNALMLPLLSEVRAHPLLFQHRYAMMIEMITVLAAAYLIFFTAAGGSLLPIVFGPNYDGLASIVGCLAAMWALRMLQAPPGMALMARGDTEPLLIAGLVRATGLSLSISAINLGYGLLGAAFAGVLAEGLSLTYIVSRTAAQTIVPWRISAIAVMLLFAAAAIGPSLAILLHGAPITLIVLAVLASVAMFAAGLLAMPSSRSLIIENRSKFTSYLPGAKRKGRGANAAA